MKQTKKAVVVMNGKSATNGVNGHKGTRKDAPANPVITPEVKLAVTRAGVVQAAVSNPVDTSDVKLLPPWLQDLCQTEGWAAMEDWPIISLMCLRFVKLAHDEAVNPGAGGMARLGNWWAENLGCGYKKMGRVLLNWNKQPK